MPGQQSSAWTKNITEVFQKLYIHGVSWNMTVGEKFKTFSPIISWVVWFQSKIYLRNELQKVFNI